MRQGLIKYNNEIAGILTEQDDGIFRFQYDETYVKDFPNLFITFEMPVSPRPYTSNTLFPFFDGLIPEGWLLSIAEENWKINRNDRMGLLLACCQNAIGAVSVHPLNNKRDA